jgi:monovalent cation/proton antiporter MnhG/PhaG subunit
MTLEGLLLAATIACIVLSVIGVLLTRDVYERLHYLSGVGAIGVFFLAAAVWVRHGLTGGAVKALLIAIILFFTNSVLTHATARAAWVRKHGKWDPLARGVERMPGAVGRRKETNE